MILKRVTNLLYVAVFSRKIELFGGVKVDIEYHRLCLWRTCKTGFVCWTMLFCRSCRVYDSLSRDCNIFKSINFVYMFPNSDHLSTKAPFVIPHGWPLYTGLIVLGVWFGCQNSLYSLFWHTFLWRKVNPRGYSK